MLTVQYDGERYLLCAVRDAVNQATRHYRIDPDTGEVRGSLLPLSIAAATGTAGTGVPPQIISLGVASTTATTVTISWTTDQDTNARVEYGRTDALGSATVLAPTLQRTHEVTIANLSPVTTWYLQAVSTNAGGQTVRSPVMSLVTGRVAEPPAVISSLNATAQDETTLRVTWTTDKDATSQVRYGFYDEAGSYTVSVTPLDRTATRNHSVTIDGLTGGRTYTWFVTSIDANNNETVSPTRNVTMPDETPPVISNIVANVTATWVTLTWENNEPADHFVRWGQTTAYGVTSPVDATRRTRHTCFISGLPAATTFHCQIRCKDAAGLTGVSTDQVFTTLALPTARNVGCLAVSSTYYLLKDDGTFWVQGPLRAALPGASSTTQASLAQVPEVTGATALTACYTDGKTPAVRLSDGNWWRWIPDEALATVGIPAGSSFTPRWDGKIVYGNADHTAGTLVNGTLTAFSGLINVQQIGWGSSSGRDFYLALKTNGTVWAWGANGYGVLGDGTTTEHSTPALIADLPSGSIVAVGATYFASTAVQDDGMVWVWGENAGPLPIAKTIKVPTPGAIKGHEREFLTVATNGELWHWKTNTEPTRLGTDFATVDSDSNRAIAIKTDGSVFTWSGSNPPTLVEGW